MIRWILVAVLAIGITATGLWGYQEHQEKNAILVQAENTYQRSFHDLSYHMDLLHDKIGTTLAMNTKERLSPQLADIWRLTSEAHNDVGQLPLALLPFNKTEEFLSNIGDFSYKTAIRDLEKDPLSDKEVESLQSLYKTSGDIKNELRKVQHLVLENNLRWMDVQLALATEDNQADNTIIDGFKTVEKTVEGYTEGNLGPSMTGTSSEKHEFKFLTGKKLNENQAMERARQLFDLDEQTEITLAKSGDGAEVDMYSASYHKDGRNGYMDFSMKGGHPLSLIINREVKDASKSLNEGMEIAQDYLERLELSNMEPFQSSQYNNVGVINFLYTQDEIRMYPDSVQVKVALDNGDILGFTSRDYFLNHQEREIAEPKMTEEEAKKMVNGNIDIQEARLSVIENDTGEEVLTYEFLGLLENETYRIFINAMTGSEEKVEKLKGTEEKFEQAV
ncbi:germination protein YpeB [Sediminibacillus albus]|uniref:Spore germination protein n=1 Tax=Sediminibacillus albus TaxID=407036 RepID=A0A1G8VM81_9BACI|nr:germination protein YpeB [Sediminibacillus albus]SDJ67083.1 spore germination protein [Sediminibacillus albus]